MAAALPLCSDQAWNVSDVLDAMAPTLSTSEHSRRAASASYAAAPPFPHAVADGVFPACLLRAVAQELPQSIDKQGCARGASRCFNGGARELHKSQIVSERAMGGATRLLFATLRAPPFVRWLEQLTGIAKLRPDPGYSGSGVHITAPGGRLGVHADFNHLPLKPSWHRRVNTFVYLNDEWPEAYGGHLELWDRNLTACATRVLPTMGRFVAFSTTDFSFHGHPVPLAAPLGRARRSVALYYYTVGVRPPAECLKGRCSSMHTTIFKSTPLCSPTANAAPSLPSGNEAPSKRKRGKASQHHMENPSGKPSLPSRLSWERIRGGRTTRGERHLPHPCLAQKQPAVMTPKTLTRRKRVLELCSRPM